MKQTMNLWQYFPESLLKVNGILKLPYVVIALYLYLLFACYQQPEQRKNLSVFLILSLGASLLMFLTLGPGIGKIFPPLALLLVALMPLVMLIMQLKNKSYAAARTWAVASMAGLLHGISWGVWLTAMARS